MAPSGKFREVCCLTIRAHHDEPVLDWRAHDLVVRAVDCLAITTSRVPDVVQEIEVMGAQRLTHWVHNIEARAAASRMPAGAGRNQKWSERPAAHQPLALTPAEPPDKRAERVAVLPRRP
ncbi:MAG: hypothetical protein ACR2RV_14690 [Verrucomicrobiales bacterium]